MTDQRIKFLSPFVEGDMSLEEIELVCVEDEKHAEVRICIRLNALLPIMTVRMTAEQTFSAAKKAYPSAVMIGRAMVQAWNKRDQSEESEFDKGVMWAAEWLTTDHDETTIAAELVNSAGIGKEDFALMATDFDGKKGLLEVMDLLEKNQRRKDAKNER